MKSEKAAKKRREEKKKRNRPIVRFISHLLSITCIISLGHTRSSHNFAMASGYATVWRWKWKQDGRKCNISVVIPWMTPYDSIWLEHIMTGVERFNLILRCDAWKRIASAWRANASITIANLLERLSFDAFALTQHSYVRLEIQYADA